MKSDVQESPSREPLQDAEDRPEFQGIRADGAQMESWRVTAGEREVLLLAF